MADFFSPTTRSEMMSRVHSKDTAIEMSVRKALHARGFRYRLHGKGMPGKPDLVLPKYSAVIFVHGCFWHGHDCHLFRMPKSRRDFWKKKIESNRMRDSIQLETLQSMGWRTLVVWECAIRNQADGEFAKLIDSVADWILSDKVHKNLRGYHGGLSCEPKS